MKRLLVLAGAVCLIAIPGCKEDPSVEAAMQSAAQEQPVAPVVEGNAVKKAEEAVNKEEINRAAAAFVAEYGTVAGALYQASALAYWKAANTGDKAAFDEYAKNDLELKKYHSDPEKFKKIGTFLEHKAILDPVTARALKVIELSYRENQLPKEMLEKLVNKASEIEMVFNTFRAEVGGKKLSNNDLLEVLSKELDVAKRQEAWEALKQVGQKVGPMLLDLARTRNEAAKMLGFENFWDMKMRMQEHDPAMVTKLFEELKLKTDKPFADMKAEMDAELGRKFKVDTKTLAPWHYDNPFFQAAPPSENLDLDVFYKGKTKEDIVAIGEKVFADIGMPLDSIITNSDYYEREGKDQHAFCTDMDRMGDVRMLLNIKPTAEWMDTMLHESGHAAYAKYNNPKLPWALRDSAHILTTEGVAMMFGALPKTTTWLKTYLNADPALVDKVAPELAKQRKREQLIFARWAMVMYFFERYLYSNPDLEDLNKLWYDYVEQFQGLNRPAGRNTLPDWAAKPHFTIAPVYYHNYFMGELFAAMTRKKLAEIAGHEGPTNTLDFVGKKDFGAFMITKIFEPGMTLPLPEFVQAAFGTPFSPDAFVAEVQ